jgi:uncharacterized protein YceK
MLDGVGIAGSTCAVYQLGTGQPINDDGVFALGMLATVDVPFSLVGDTLTLPWALVKYAQQNPINMSHPKVADEASGSFAQQNPINMSHPKVADEASGKIE